MAGYTSSVKGRKDSVLYATRLKLSMLMKEKWSNKGEMRYLPDKKLNVC